MATLLSQEILVTSVVDLKLNFQCSHMYRTKRLCLKGDSSKVFPGKFFVQYKLILNFTAGLARVAGGITCANTFVLVAKPLTRVAKP